METLRYNIIIYRYIYFILRCTHIQVLGYKMKCSVLVNTRKIIPRSVKHSSRVHSAPLLDFMTPIVQRIQRPAGRGFLSYLRATTVF